MTAQDTLLSATWGGGVAALPCVDEPDLWFAEHAGATERAKELCRQCLVQPECLAAALERDEPWGVWGGEVFERGRIVEGKRGRGRPRKDSVA